MYTALFWVFLSSRLSPYAQCLPKTCSVPPACSSIHRTLIKISIHQKKTFQFESQQQMSNNCKYASSVLNINQEWACTTMRIKSDYELEQQWASTVNTRMNNENQQQHEHHQLCPSFLGLFFVGHYPTYRYNCYNKGSIPIQSSITPEHRFDDHARKVWCIIKMLVDDTKHNQDVTVDMGVTHWPAFPPCLQLFSAPPSCIHDEEYRCLYCKMKNTL